MADKDPEENLSLQLPSFGFGRKKSKDEPVDADPVEPEASQPVEPEPEPEPEAEPEAEASEPAEPAPVPAVDPAPRPKPARKPEPAPVPVPMQGRVEHVDPSVRPPASSTLTQTQQVPVDTETKRGLSFPAIPALQAVLAVGALIGILGVLLTFASLKFCELVRGTDSCGGPGLLLLLATLVVLTYVGAWLLRGFGIDDPGSTSFLAVALLAVMTMVFFLDVIYSWWLVLVIPLVSMAMYALSWWVTGFVDTDDSPT